MDPEFYVEKPNKLIALTIATLNAGISIGIAASLAGSLIALHARGGPGDLATTKPCPNSEYGILAFCIAAAILGTSYISAAVVRRAKPIHAELMRINPRAGGSFGPERIVGFIMDVAGAPYVEAASLAFDAFKAKWSPSVREVVHWLLKGEPRPQVGKMLLMQGPAGGETQRRALLGYFSELWSFDVIERVARNATLDGGRVTISCWRDDREIVRVDEFAALRSKAKVIVNGWGPRDVERQLQKALTFERQQVRIVEINRPEVVVRRVWPDEEQGALESVVAAGVVERRRRGRAEAALDPLEKLMQNARLSVEHCTFALNDIHTGAPKAGAVHESARGHDQGR